MEKVLNGDSTIQILRNALNKMEPRLTSHGERVAYIFYHMLMMRQIYSKKLLDDFFIIGLLHDICAYKTDEIDLMFTFESKGVWSHSIYGYLYLRYLSPLRESAETVLYHHLNYNKFVSINYQYKYESMLLYIADRIDIMMQTYGSRLNMNLFERKRNTSFWGEGLDLFYKAEDKFDLTGRLINGNYKKDLDRFISHIELTPYECKTYLRLLVYMLDFKTERTTIRNVSANIFADVIAREMHLDYESSEALYYASIIYDIGMLAMPGEILRAPRELTASERSIVKNHVSIAKSVLNGYISPEIINIVSAHHERMNGSGYPDGLKGGSLSKPQRILAAADVISALNSSNERREAYSVDEIKMIIRQEATEGKLCGEVVNTFLKNSDYIMDFSSHLYQDALQEYWAIKEQYDIIIKRFEAFNSL